jgi:hypothetical protein
MPRIFAAALLESRDASGENASDFCQPSVGRKRCFERAHGQLIRDGAQAT